MTFLYVESSPDEPRDIRSIFPSHVWLKRSRFLGADIWCYVIGDVILNEKSLWIHQNNATGLLFGRTWTSLSLLNPFRSYSGFSGAGSCGKGGGETDELWYPHRYDTVSTEFSRPDGLKLNIYQRDLPNFDVCRVSVLSRPSSDYSVAVRLLYFREYWS